MTLILVTPNSAFAVAEAKRDFVVLISVDGLGQRLLETSDAPFLKSLNNKTAMTVIPTKTLPAHSSMLSGVKPERHHILENKLEDGVKAIGVPTLFNLLTQNQIPSAAIFGKRKLRVVLDNGAITFVENEISPWLGEWPDHLPSYVETKALEFIEKKQVRFLFIHYALPDTMGHWFKWESWPQKLAVHSVDASIERLVKKVKTEYPDGRFAILITADHGGHKGSHGQGDGSGLLTKLESPETDQLVPWILIGAGEQKTDLKSQVFIYDTAPTIANLFDLQVPDAWHWQGVSALRAPQAPLNESPRFASPGTHGNRENHGTQGTQQ